MSKVHSDAEHSIALLNQDHSFHLEDRIALATALAWSLSSFHDAKWVHKRFTSDNILLFQSTQGSEVSWGTPYLVGFELTRPNIAWSGPIDRAALLWSNRVYTHPDRVENEPSTIRFRKIHDIYSLGVVLLEIGMMTTVTSQKWEQELGTLRSFQDSQSVHYNGQIIKGNYGKCLRRSYQALSGVGLWDKE